MLRAAVQKQTPLGLEAKAAMDKVCNPILDILKSLDALSQ
jgi:adenylate kinase family enzyme